jgi:ribosome-associated protein
MPMRYTVPLEEMETRATRAGGPGGQHVNKTATRVEVLWNVRRSPTLTDTQRARLMERLGTRLTGEGVLRVVSSQYRSQFRNREAGIERLRNLVARALEVPKPRRRTRPPAAAREQRLRLKKRRAEVKRSRRVAPEED